MNKDFLIQDDGDLLIKDGDLVVGPSIEQEIIWILQMEKGHLKSSPSIGASLTRHTRGVGSKREEIEKSIRLNLEADGKNYSQMQKLIKLKTTS